MFKEGDWVFEDFELKQVQKVEGVNGVTQVSNGYMVKSGWDLRCFPLTLRIKCISGEFKHWSDRLHKEGKNLNFPDIHRYLVNLWAATCERADNNDYISSSYKQLREWCENILRMQSQVKDIRFDGVKAFK